VDGVTEHDEKVRILLVDDKPDALLALEMILEDLGEEIVKAQSGREALRLLLREEFAVILLDVNMPGMDGFETAELIRRRKRSEHTPIIFLTAFSDEMYVARGYSLGAVDYIMAPVVPEVLRATVGVFADLHRKTRQLTRQAECLEQRALQLHRLTEASLPQSSRAALPVSRLFSGRRHRGRACPVRSVVPSSRVTTRTPEKDLRFSRNCPESMRPSWPRKDWECSG
jgi:CheY-like chemotaxis protein